MFVARGFSGLVYPVVCLGFGALCAASVACTTDSSISPSEDAGHPDGSLDNPDATVSDGGHDSDANAHDASSDGTAHDAEPDAQHAEDAGDGGAGDGEAGTSCVTILAKAFAASIRPPGSYAGLDLSNGGAADGGVGSGGLTIDKSGLLDCASWVEPTVLDAGLSPDVPGYRQAAFDAPSAQNALQLQFNMESRVIDQMTMSPGYTGTLEFHSRSGGAYGTHSYVIAVMSPGDAGATGEVLRDGTPFAADWNNVTEDGGALEASPWANELYDGLMATFSPSTPAVADCLTTTITFDIPGLPMPGSACLFISNVGDGQSLFGVRPLALYFEFTQLTNQVSQMYSFWPGGNASCSTPQAALEQMTWGGISLGYAPAINETTYFIAGNEPMRGASNPLGLTDTELNTLFGCGAVSWTPPDPGYGGMQWASGAVAAEYNLDSGVNYKVYAQSGYQGAWVLPEDDGGTYNVGVGSMTLGGSPVTIDWSDASSADATITSIANALYGYQCSAPPDTDCAAQGDCTIVADDGNGHSTFSLAPSANMQNNYCGAMQAITVSFAKGSSTPEQIYVTNPGGQ